MPLQKSAIPYLFSQGLDSKTNPQLTTKLSVLENGVFNKAGRINKRNGYTALGNSVQGGGTVTGLGLSVFSNDLLALSGSNLYSYVGSQDTWINKGTCVSISSGNTSVVRNDYEQTVADAGTLNGITLVAWQDTRGGVRISVLNSATNAPILADTAIDSAGSLPKVIPAGQFLFLFWVSGTNLKVKRFDPSAPTTIPTSVTVASDVSASAILHDECAVGVNIAFTYVNTGGSAKAGYWTQGNVIGGAAGTGLPAVVTVSQSPTNAISIAYGGLLYIAGHDGTNGVRVSVLNSDLTTSTAVATVDAYVSTAVKRITALATATGATYFYEKSATQSYNTSVAYVNVTTAGAPGGVSTIRSVGLASKAFSVAGTTYVTCTFDSTLQATYFTLRADGVVVARSLSGNGGGLAAAAILPEVQVTGTQVQLPLLRKGNLQSANSNLFTLRGVSLATQNYNPTAPMTSQMGQNLHITGGMLQAYDGQRVVEHGFHIYPENITASASTSGGSISATTTTSYQYSVIYEWTDAAGQIHRSGTSVPVSPTWSGTTSTGAVTLTIPTLRVTAKTGVRIQVYRTQANGTVFYKVPGASDPTYNDPTSDSISFVDTAADASIAGNEFLYTTGGVLDNSPAPACSVVKNFDNRVFTNDTEDPLAVWYSRSYYPGEGAAFSDSLTINMDAQGGPVTAMEALDGNLIIFKNSSIYVVAGSGPADNGTQSGYSIPQRIATDVGCVAPKSVTLTADGIMFQSRKGLYLLNRALQCEYVGAGVEEANGLTVSSATLIDSQNQVRVLTNGTCQVYSYAFREWSTFTNHAGLDSVLWKGTYVYLRADGRVYSEAPGVFTDNGLPVKLRVTTGWLSVAGIQGFSRVYRALFLGDYKGAHTLTVSTAYDFRRVFEDVVTFQPGNVLQTSYFGSDAYFGASSPYGGDDSVYQFQVNVRQQKCEAIKFQIEDTYSDTGKEGLSLTGLTLECGIKAGAYRVNNNKVSG